MKQSLKILSPTFDVASDRLSGNSVGSGFVKFWRAWWSGKDGVSVKFYAKPYGQ